MAAVINTCGARKRDGGLCGRAPTLGNKRCRLHGGNGADVERKRQQAAIRKLAPADMFADLDTDDPEFDPVAGFFRDYRRTVSAIRYWESQIAQLSSEDLTYGIVKTVEVGSSEYPGTDVTYEAKLNAAHAAWVAERDHLADLVKIYATARLGEARASVERRFADEISRMIDSLIEALGNNPRDEKMRALVARLVADAGAERHVG